MVNLLYLIRRTPRYKVRLGSLQAWMTSHIATGILALLCTMLHAAMSPEDTVGGHAFWALAVLIVTGLFLLELLRVSLPGKVFASKITIELVGYR